MKQAQLTAKAQVDPNALPWVLGSAAAKDTSKEFEYALNMRNY